MNQQKHEFVNGRCVHCGAMDNPQSQMLTCLQRAIPKDELRPEPARRQYSCEAFDDIKARLDELAKERLPESVTPADFDMAAAGAYC